MLRSPDSDHPLHGRPIQTSSLFLSYRDDSADSPMALWRYGCIKSHGASLLQILPDKLPRIFEVALLIRNVLFTHSLRTQLSANAAGQQPTLIHCFSCLFRPRRCAQNFVLGISSRCLRYTSARALILIEKFHFSRYPQLSPVFKLVQRFRYPELHDGNILISEYLFPGKRIISLSLNSYNRRISSLAS